MALENFGKSDHTSAMTSKTAACTASQSHRTQHDVCICPEMTNSDDCGIVPVPDASVDTYAVSEFALTSDSASSVVVVVATDPMPFES